MSLTGGRVGPGLCGRRRHCWHTRQPREIGKCHISEGKATAGDLQTAWDGEKAPGPWRISGKTGSDANGHSSRWLQLQGKSPQILRKHSGTDRSLQIINSSMYLRAPSPPFRRQVGVWGAQVGPPRPRLAGASFCSEAEPIQSGIRHAPHDEGEVPMYPLSTTLSAFTEPRSKIPRRLAIAVWAH